LRAFGPEIISCPTCSRCEVNLIDIVNRCRKEIEKLDMKRPLRIALMGCVVNGPGEGREADGGRVQCGQGRAALPRPGGGEGLQVRHRSRDGERARGGGVLQSRHQSGQADEHTAHGIRHEAREHHH
ncbi:MAG: flavodoxin-dependent (E)-4-hydroxy-3-methylbut-2-enyl-diphosphate synthase, partial [Candidatus Thermoplasmatota archaeon]|nr:flavodoxin-dependent (E)-4-hydroxy-3-methylbut-2-enyl-diphosphate synthase [Candidatus Thermoplasmatota archaeon]